jgi:hypothetical protein
MNKYTVIFEIYGKIIKVEVKASTEALAKLKVKNAIIFHSVSHHPHLTNGKKIK